MMSPDLIDGALWSLGGLIVGYGLGHFSRRVADSDASTPPPPRRRVTRSELLRTVIGLVLLLLVLASTVRYYQVTSCQQEYLQAVQASLTARSDATGAEAAAQVELLQAQLSGDPTKGAAAIRKYIDAVIELERVRQANPLPGPDSCGETS